MDARANRDVREFEVAVLSVEAQVDAREIASDDECDEIAEAISNSPAHTQSTIVRRSKLVGIERQLTGADAEKEPVRVKFLARPCGLAEKGP